MDDSPLVQCQVEHEEQGRFATPCIPVHFSICTEGVPYLNISKKTHTICMGEVPKL